MDMNSGRQSKMGSLKEIVEDKIAIERRQKRKEENAKLRVQGIKKVGLSKSLMLEVV